MLSEKALPSPAGKRGGSRTLRRHRRGSGTSRRRGDLLPTGRRAALAPGGISFTPAAYTRLPRSTHPAVAFRLDKGELSLLYVGSAFPAEGSSRSARRTPTARCSVCTVPSAMKATITATAPVFRGHAPFGHSRGRKYYRGDRGVSLAAPSPGGTGPTAAALRGVASFLRKAAVRGTG